jgi:hypothetical protein
MSDLLKNDQEDDDQSDLLNDYLKWKNYHTGIMVRGAKQSMCEEATLMR